jgi:pantetheine-phosphate adenylyltransferase
MFDEIVIGIGKNSTKQAFLSPEVRLELLQEITKDYPNVKAVLYEGLTVEYCKTIGAQVMIRGIRTVSDFEYEKAIAQMNHAMFPEIESIFIVSKPGFSSLSSTIVRDIIRNKGKIENFVPKEVVDYISQRK